LTVLLLGTFLAVLLPVPGTQAQMNMNDFKKPMPKLELTPQEAFLKKTRLYTEKPMDDPTLTYRIRLPLGWEKAQDKGMGTLGTASKIFGEIARFYGPLTPMIERSRFTVEVSQLEYRVTAEQWLLQHLLSNGFTIQGLRTYSGDKVEALFVFIERDISFAVRAVAQISGQRIVLAQYLLPMEKWHEEKGMQEQVMATFALDQAKEESIEKMLRYQFLDVAQIQYPESWTLRSGALKSIDRMDVEILNIAAKPEEERKSYLNGKITASLVSGYVAGSLDGEIRRVRRSYEDQGLVFGEEVPTTLEFQFHDLFEFAGVKAYKAGYNKNRMINYEVWIASGLAGDYYYFVSLLSPSREQDYFLWSRNTQTFKLFLSQITPLEESLTGE
jgi:hypothetical protein